MSNKFHKYVNSIRKEDEAKRAGQRGDRNDYTLDEEAGGAWHKVKGVRFAGVDLFSFPTIMTFPWEGERDVKQVDAGLSKK